MPTLIKNVRQRNIVEFDQGKFDDWCVYLTRPNRPRYAPLDIEYFSRLQELGRTHGLQRIYNDFVQVYNPTNRVVNPVILNNITTIADTYGSDAEEVDIWLTVIYAGMIAEENKQFAVLKKRVKRLGMHQVLLENMAPAVAANFSKGKKWRELDQIMRPKGF
jgi:hypothetical protein